MILRFIFIYLFIIIFRVDGDSSSDYFLPKTLYPLTYNIIIYPNLEQSIFSGSLILKFSTHEETNCLFINAKDLRLKFKTAVLIDHERSNIPIDQIVFNNTLERIIIKSSKPFQIGYEYDFCVEYEGDINDDGFGLYRASYKGTGGNIEWLAATQLRPVHARRVFPCFDEPTFKAKFLLTIVHSPKYFAIANTQSVKISNKGNVTITQFKETPLIPPFLVAFIVSSLPDKVVGLDNFTSYAVPLKISGAEFSSVIGPKMAEKMAAHTEIAYPVDKTDQIALPKLVPVAMENWALFNFKEQFILYFDKEDKSIQRQTVGRFSGHEIAHSWMGNAVSLGWWDFLWLSEAFAMYYEYYLPGQVYPSWKMMEQLVVDLHQLGLQLDSVQADPLTTTVVTPQEISAKFGGVTYSKGPAILRMAIHIIKESNYINGFRSFLRNHWWGNVWPNDLWNTLEEHSEDVKLPKSLSDIMTPWTTTSGYPVVSVTRKYNSGVLQLTQKKFILDDTKNVDNMTWWIPLSYTYGHDPDFFYTTPKTWFKPQHYREIKTQLAENEWILFNIQSTGFYRVNYDERNWRLLISQLFSNCYVIDVINRAALVDDALNLARAGQLSYSVAMDLTKYLSLEIEYLPWASGFKALEFLSEILTNSFLQDHFKTYMLYILDDIYNVIGFSEKLSDTHLTRLTRELIVKWACEYGHRDCVSKSSGYVRSLVAGSKQSVSVDVRDTALCTGVEATGTKVWMFMLSRFRDADDELNRQKYLNVLACTIDSDIIKKFLIESIQELDESNWFRRFTALAAKPRNAFILLEILQLHRTELEQTYGLGNYVKYINQLANILTTKEHLTILQGLESENIDLSKAKRTIEGKMRWLERHGNKLKDYFLQTALVFQ